MILSITDGKSGMVATAKMERPGGCVVGEDMGGQNGNSMLDLQVGTYLLAGSIPTKATKHLKSPLVTRYLIGNRNGNQEG